MVFTIRFSLTSTGLKSPLLALCLGCVLTFVSAAGQEPSPPHLGQHKTWKQYGGGADQSKYMDLKQITRHNVNQLEVVWNYADPSPGGNLFNSIVVDGIMYVVAKGGSIVALDAATGGEKWSSVRFPGIIRTGINYWESKDKKDPPLTCPLLILATMEPPP